MSAVTTFAAMIAATAGGVALYRFAQRRKHALREYLRDSKVRANGRQSEMIIDYERDPESGVFRPKA